MGEPAYQLPEEDRADTRPDLPNLRALEGGGEGDGVPKGNLSSVDKNNDPDDGSKGAKSDSKDDEPSLFNKDGDNSRASSLKGTVRKLASNKLIVGGALSSTFIGALVIIAILLLGSLKIPNLMEHITSYQFARVTRQMSQSASRVNEAKLVIDAADQSTYSKFKARYYSQPTGKLAEKWSYFDKYRPQKVLNNLDKTSTFKLVYDDQTILGRKRLSGVIIDGGKPVPIEKPTGASRFMPGAKFKNNISYARKVAPALSERTATSGPIIRGLVAREVRQRLGIGLVAWKIGQFKGKNELQAKAEQARRLNSVVDDGKVQPSKSSLLNGTGERANAVEQANLADDGKVVARLANDGIDPEAAALIEKSIKPSLTSTIIGAVNPIYGILVPVCLVYDGSLESSGPTIDDQTLAQKKTYYYLASAADQQKNGYDVEQKGVSALNQQLGDISTSNPELRASGQTVDTSSEISTQASANGTYSLLDAIFPGPIAAAGDKVAETCPYITNTYLGVAVGIANIGLLIASLGTAAAPEGALEVASTGIIRTISTKVTASVSSRVAARATAGQAKVLATDAAISAGKIVGATLLAKLIIYLKMGSFNNGLQSNTDLVHAADSGGNMAAGDLSQKQFFAAPMAKAAVVADARDNQAWTNLQRTDQSLSTRYIALDNPDSLLTKVAMLAQSRLGSKSTTFIPSLVKSLASLPSSLFASITGRSFAAEDVSSSKTYYGNVQFGYTSEEQALLTNNDSYHLLDNQKILEDSGKEPKIATIYAKCFGYTSDDQGNLTMDGPSLGELLASGEIRRDGTGNVIDSDDDCSPSQLGINNTTYGDLVFRWRVANSDTNALKQLTDLQDVTAEETTNSTEGSPETATGTPISGDAKIVAQAILANSNIDLTTYRTSVKADVEAAAAGRNGTAGVPTSVAILNLIAAVGKDHKVLVTAIQSGGQGHSATSLHYTGDGVDFGSLDGARLTGRDGGSITIINISAGILPSGSGIGQKQCGQLPGLPAGFNQFNDTCNHLHFQVPRGTP